MREVIRKSYFEMANSMIREVARLKDAPSIHLDPVVSLMEEFVTFSTELLGHKIITEKEHDAIDDRAMDFRRMVELKQDQELASEHGIAHGDFLT
jgi:hypothetical protein